MGPIQNRDLEASQLVMAGFVGLMAGQGQWLVFILVTFKYSKVQEVPVSLNLGEEIPPNNTCLLNSTAMNVLIFPLFQPGLHLVGEGWVLAAASAHHPGGRRTDKKEEPAQSADTEEQQVWENLKYFLNLTLRFHNKMIIFWIYWVRL